MSNLRDLIFIQSPGDAKYKQLQLAVFNGREGTGVQDGGRCCCWIIPTGTTWATFEMWGAGGDGGGACCCQGPYRSAGTGQYSKKTLNVSASNGYFNLCAAGSGCCSQACMGTCGFPSFVTCCNGVMAGCAQGGSGGCTVCHRMGGLSCTGLCVPGCWQGCGGVGDIQLGSLSQPDKQNNFCVNANIAFSTAGLKYTPNTRRNFDPCAVGMTNAGCCYSGGQMTTWPGGSGSAGQACGGPCCWGGWGTGGLVLITYG